MPDTWTRKDQEAYLSEQIPAFLSAQRQLRKHAALREFLKRVFKVFCNRWPQDVGEDGSANRTKKRQQIKSWFYRHGPGNAKGEMAPAKKIVHRYIHKQSPQRKRPVRPIEMYHHLNKDALRPIISRHISDAEATTRSAKMQIRRQVVRDMWEKEDDDVIKTVEEACQKQNSQSSESAALGGDDDINRAAHTPESYKAALRSLPSVLRAVLEPLAEETGWIIFATAAGPHPDTNEIFQQNYYFGVKNPSGKDFKDGYPDFIEAVQIPFHNHAAACFTQDGQPSRVVMPDTTPPTPSRLPEDPNLHSFQDSPSSSEPESEEDQGDHCESEADDVEAWVPLRVSPVPESPGSGSMGQHDEQMDLADSAENATSDGNSHELNIFDHSSEQNIPKQPTLVPAAPFTPRKRRGLPSQSLQSFDYVVPGARITTPLTHGLPPSSTPKRRRNPFHRSSTRSPERLRVTYAHAPKSKVPTRAHPHRTPRRPEPAQEEDCGRGKRKRRPKLDLHGNRLYHISTPQK